MEASASFEEDEVVNYAQEYDKTLMGVTHDCIAFFVSPLHLHEPHPHTKNTVCLHKLLNLCKHTSSARKDNKTYRWKKETLLSKCSLTLVTGLAEY